MAHTKGKWKLGKTGGTVVSDYVPDNANGNTGHAETDYYGGFLIAESILFKADAKLIAAAPEMFQMLKTIHCIENAAFSLKSFNVERLKRDIAKVIEQATQLDNQK